jgi:type II secretory pathway component PulJ
MTTTPANIDAGWTLIEIVVASALTILVGAMFANSMFSLQSAVSTAADRSLSNDEVRLAVADLDRQVRSGNILHDPATEAADPVSGVDPGYSLRIYTQSNAPTATPSNRCVQWRVRAGVLETREWSEEWRADGVVSGWRRVAGALVNKSRNVTPFVLDADSRYGGRIVRVSFLVQTKASSGGAVRIDASLTGRNTQFGYPDSICDDIPTA